MKKLLVTSLAVVVVLSVLSACAPQRRKPNPAQPAADTAAKTDTTTPAPVTPPPPASDGKVTVGVPPGNKDGNNQNRTNVIGAGVTRANGEHVNIDVTQPGTPAQDARVTNDKGEIIGKVSYRECVDGGYTCEVDSEITTKEGKVVKTNILISNKGYLKVKAVATVDKQEQELKITDASFKKVRYTEDDKTVTYTAFDINGITEDKTTVELKAPSTLVGKENTTVVLHNAPVINDANGKPLSYNSGMQSVSGDGDNLVYTATLLSEDKQPAGILTITVSVPKDPDVKKIVPPQPTEAEKQAAAAAAAAEKAAAEAKAAAADQALKAEQEANDKAAKEKAEKEVAEGTPLQSLNLTENALAAEFMSEANQGILNEVETRIIWDEIAANAQITDPAANAIAQKVTSDKYHAMLAAGRERKAKEEAQASK
jgi:hypothetical protein